MTKLNEQVKKELNGWDFDLQASVYIGSIDDFVDVDYSLKVIDAEDLANDLDIVNSLNALAVTVIDDAGKLRDDVLDMVYEALSNHPYDKELSGVESLFEIKEI